MNSLVPRGRNLMCLPAGLLFLGACLAFAQDWKTADSLPGVDFGNLSPAQKATVLKILREHDCTCGCGMKMAECRMVDPKCSYSQGLAGVIIDAVKQGKNEADAIAAANQSRWAHVRGSQVLDDPVSIPIGGSPSIGPANAPVTLVEFSDFQCPYCAQAAPELRALAAAYPSQVRLVFKQFPLEIHSQAQLAAEAAIAAHNQGKFWVMHDAMFAHRNDLSRDGLVALARQNGLDVKRFEADLDSTEVRETIVRDIQDGDRAGVDGTPAVFVNGQRYNGAISIDALKPILDGELKHPGHASQNASTKQ